MKTISEIVLIALVVASLGCSERQPTSFAHPEGSCPGQNEFVPVNIIAEMTYYEVPQYPRLAEQAGLEGTVWIKGQIGNAGSVLDAIVYKSSGVGLLDDAALQSAYRCEFNPAVMDDQPVCMWVTWRVDFELPDGTGTWDSDGMPNEHGWHSNNMTIHRAK